MNKKIEPKKPLTAEQDFAATPTENVWVQANAGTGKTSVLVERLLRVFFRTSNLSNVGILCLTYTITGASVMRNKILAALSDWACATDDQVRDLLQGIAYNQPATDADIARAREIFFFFIDNPDVLKIKTFHSFCEEILHRFPDEAGLSPAWSVISGEVQKNLQRDAFDKMINSSELTPEQLSAFEHFVAVKSESAISDLLRQLTKLYPSFFGVSDLVKYRSEFIETTRKTLELDTPLPPLATEQELRQILADFKNDAKRSTNPSNYLKDIISNTEQYLEKTIDFAQYKSAYLKKVTHILKIDYLVAEQKRMSAYDERERNQRVFDDTIALFDLATAFTSVYRQMKQQRNVLDFDDMLLYTRRLFTNPEKMGWVLSQMDYSLTHILVDEAQDTSPLQWEILQIMATEFFVDGDTGDLPHTMFVVGDTKQAIYGFQNTSPTAFINSRDVISEQIRGSHREIRNATLDRNFRSYPQILSTVDFFFDDNSVRELSGFVNNPHQCAKQDKQGLVEVYKVVTPVSSKDANYVAKPQLMREYIDNIATHIKSIVDSGEYKPEDIMVLVRNRKPFADKIISRLKRMSVPVAGSDKIILPNFPAIRDLLRLARYVLNTRDHFSLGCVLRGPLYRLSHGDIYNLCRHRNDYNQDKDPLDPTVQRMSLSQAVQELIPDLFADLAMIRNWGLSQGPYTFFSNVLNHNNNRAKLISALGNQILDPLEEFMTICLSYERTQPGTLRQFLKFFITGDSEIKRELAQATGVRVLTAHSSKGMEAKVVFLIDTMSKIQDDDIVFLPSTNTDTPPAFLWASSNPDTTAFARAIAPIQQQQIAESYRLLYVAMTRAEHQLFIYGYSDTIQPNPDAWHTMLWDVLSTMPKANITPEKIRIENV